MSLAFPNTFSAEEPLEQKELLNRLQENLDVIGQQFPVSPANASQVPQARVYNSAALTIVTATPTALTFDSERWDTGSLHSTAVNTSRLTCTIPGLYLASASVNWVFNAAGFRHLYLQHSVAGRFAADLDHADAAAGNQQTVTSTYRLAAGEYVEAFVQQTSGGNLNVASSANYSPEFSMHWVSP